jgi:hypothetical protein
VLNYTSLFEYGLNTDLTMGSGTNSSTVETQITVESESVVDSTHSTSDFHKIEKALVESEVVTTYTDDVTGQFATNAEMTSGTWTDVHGSSHFEFGGGSFGGFTAEGEGENDSSFDDNRYSAVVIEAHQSGSYGEGEEDSSSSDHTMTATETFSSQSQGTYSWSMPGSSMSGTFESTREGSSSASSVSRGKKMGPTRCWPRRAMGTTLSSSRLDVRRIDHLGLR